MKLTDKVDIKIFILYLLNSVNEPLEFNSINDIVLQDEFVGYFDFAFAFSELLDSQQVVEAKKDEGGFYYTISELGIETLNGYESSIYPVIKDRALKCAMRPIAFNKTASSITTSLTEEDKGFRLDCAIHDHEKPLFSVNVYLTEREYAEKMEKNFRERAEIIFRGALSLLSGDVNFIFDE